MKVMLEAKLMLKKPLLDHWQLFLASLQPWKTQDFVQQILSPGVFAITVFINSYFHP